MSLEAVVSKLRKKYDLEPNVLTGALADAERMADQYADVRPQAYNVPIERFVGLPVLGASEL